MSNPNFGLGPLRYLKTEGQQVLVGSLGVILAGVVLGQVWFATSA